MKFQWSGKKFSVFRMTEVGRLLGPEVKKIYINPLSTHLYNNLERTNHYNTLVPPVSAKERFYHLKHRKLRTKIISYWLLLYLTWQAKIFFHILIANRISIFSSRVYKCRHEGTKRNPGRIVRELRHKPAIKRQHIGRGASIAMVLVAAELNVKCICEKRMSGKETEK